MPNLPIPSDTAQAHRQASRNCRNLGLLFDRFVGYGPDWKMEGSQKRDEAQRLVDECNRWASDPAYVAMYRALRNRWRSIMDSMGAESFEATPEWRLVVGLGRESAFETGLTLHRVYGFPYIPGSAIKGMTQAWAAATSQDEIHVLFGSQEDAGKAIFFDALPVSPPLLQLDVMNPHYPEYYRPGNRKYPSDWQSPVPVHFITVKTGTRFLFGVASRDKNQTEASTTTAWLIEALQTVGLGGKTTSGYGYWKIS